MARVLFVILLIAAAAFLIYRQANQESSDEVRMVRAIEARFEIAVVKFMGAGKISGTLAASSIEETEKALAGLKRVRDEFDSLKPTLKNEKAIRLAEKLGQRIDEFFTKNEIL